jgi:hypothetical protein
VCDPTVASNHRQRTRTTPTCAPASTPRPRAPPPAAAQTKDRRRSSPAVVHRCHDAAETTLDHSRQKPAVTHRCLNPAETTLGHSQHKPAVTHRCLNTAETTLEHSQHKPAVTHRCLNPAETTLEHSQQEPAGRCRGRGGVGAHRIRPAGAPGCGGSPASRGSHGTGRVRLGTRRPVQKSGLDLEVFAGLKPMRPVAGRAVSARAESPVGGLGGRSGGPGCGRSRPGAR